MLVVVDPRQPRPKEKLLAKDFLPEVIDQRHFGKKPVPTDIEAIASVVFRLR